MAIWTAERKKKQVTDFFISQYGAHFDPAVEFDKRIDVRPDSLVYNLEDRYVYDQNKGVVPTYFTVYFDNVYICGFGEDQSPAEVNLAFWKGMQDAYKGDKIRLNKGLAQQLAADREAEIQRAINETNQKVNDLPESTEVQKLAKEAIKRVKNAKTRKPSAHA